MANPLQQAMQKQFVDDIIADKLGPLKPVLSHVGLYTGLCIYTAVGAMVRMSLFKAQVLHQNIIPGQHAMETN